MVARVISCRIESCGDCGFWCYATHGCDNPDWPKIDVFIKDPGSIPDCCPLEVAPDADS